MRIEEFYNFIKERENIRLRKASGMPFPWTTDPILSQYKFTNVRREHDKTTQKLCSLFYDSSGQTSSKKIILLNCALYRYFGTWEFAEAVGWQKSFLPEPLIRAATLRLKNKLRVFTGAYIITNQGIKAPKQEVVVYIFLTELWKNIDRIIEVLEKTNSWQKTHEALGRVQGFGGTGFMAKETLLDTMHCNFWKNGKPNDYWTWTPIGPGARRGINRLLELDKDASIKEEKCLETLLELASFQDKYWPSEWGRLAPTDFQFASCEWDKWNRVKNNEGRPRSRYVYRG